MKSAQQGVKVSIIGREYFIGCKESERSALVAAATYLDKQMRDIQQGGKVIGMDRCAIMAALNISHDLLELRRKGSESSELKARLHAIQDKIDTVMQEQKSLTL